MATWSKGYSSSMETCPYKLPFILVKRTSGQVRSPLEYSNSAVCESLKEKLVFLKRIGIFILKWNKFSPLAQKVLPCRHFGGRHLLVIAN